VRTRIEKKTKNERIETARKSANNNPKDLDGTEPNVKKKKRGIKKNKGASSNRGGGGEKARRHRV